MVFSKSPLLKLAVVKVEAPPAATSPAEATEVTKVDPINVEVPVAVAFIGVSKVGVPAAKSSVRTSIEELPVPAKQLLCQLLKRQKHSLVTREK